MYINFKKLLYGLKQSLRQWYQTFHNAIIKFEYKANNYDNCVYYWKSDSDFMILYLYVNDILISRNNILCANDVQIFRARVLK